jgi:hypothetical protein
LLSKFDSWILYNKQFSEHDNAEIEKLSDYTRSLEQALAAVYRSRSWKVFEPYRKLGSIVKSSLSGRKQIVKPLGQRPSSVKGNDPLKKWRT